MRDQAAFEKDHRADAYRKEEYHGEDHHAEEYHAVLDCSATDGNLEYCPAIYVRRLWGDQFASVRPTKTELLPPPADDANPNREGYQTIYIKQRPVYMLPEFTLMNRDARLQGAIVDDRTFVFEEVYPSDRWDANSRSLKSVYSRLDQVQGVFRFCHPYIRSIKVDVAVGLRRVNRKRWESWCSQRRYYGDSLDFVFKHFEHNLKSPNYHNISLREEFYKRLQRLAQDQMVPSEARVMETQTHGRSYISLKVMSKPEIHTSKALLFLPNHQTSEQFEQRAQDNIEEEVRKLTMACTVEDNVNFGVFATTGLTKRVRTARKTSQPNKRSFIDAAKHLLSSFGLSQFTVRDPSFRALSSLERKLSIELLYACKEGDAAQVEHLLKRDALLEVETESFHSFRPIHWVAIGGHFSVVRFLLSAGAQHNRVTSEGMTAVHLAAMMGHADVLVSFLGKAEEAESDMLCIRQARTRGTLESPLHLAAAYALPDTVSRIFNALCVPDGPGGTLIINMRNYLGETPVHRAAAANNARTLLQLLDGPRPYDPHTVDNFSRSPFWHAACTGRSDSLNALAAKGVIVDLADELGRTPLHAACREGRTKAVRTLLQWHANPNIVTHPPALTPCHYAALFGRADCLRLLLQHGAKADAPTGPSVYFKPIYLAAANGWLECVEILRSATSDPDGPCTHYIVLQEDGDATLVDRPTESSEEVATSQGHLDVAKFFDDERMEKFAIMNSSLKPMRYSELATYNDATSSTPSVFQDVSTLDGL